MAFRSILAIRAIRAIRAIMANMAIRADRPGLQGSYYPEFKTVTHLLRGASASKNLAPICVDQLRVTGAGGEVNRNE